jgi:cell division protein FtsW
MAKRLKSDATLFAATLVLVTISLTWVYSITAVKADPTSYLERQLMFVALGIVGMMVAMNLDYHVFRDRRVLTVAGALVALGLVIVLFGPQVKGGKRWLHIGAFGVQPSEFAKLVAIFFVARALAWRLEEREALEQAYAQVAIVVAGVAALVVLEPDLGTAIVLTAIVFVMVFAADLPYKWVATALAVLVPVAAAVIWFHPHSHQRIMAFLHPDRYRQGSSFQTWQSLIAIGTGGIAGNGFGQSIQKRGYLPEAQNDYIFSVISEEMGLIGSCLVVLCFALIIARGLRAARRAPDAFGSLVALGITAMIGIQSMVNLGVVTNLLPAKGITLPLVSAGGSSMIVSLVAMGVLLNISQQASATE